MKRIYFAGKFSLDNDTRLPLAERIAGDFRAKLLGDPERLIYAKDNVIMDNGHIYCGPFYCESASNGDFTSTDCSVVLREEYKSVSGCDIYSALFEHSFSVGTIVELDWALEMDKEILIFYKEEESEHDIKSEYWFAIANALLKSDKVKVFKYNDIGEVVDMLSKGDIFDF